MRDTIIHQWWKKRGHVSTIFRYKTISLLYFWLGSSSVIKGWLRVHVHVFDNQEHNFNVNMTLWSSCPKQREWPLCRINSSTRKLTMKSCFLVRHWESEHFPFAFWNLISSTFILKTHYLIKSPLLNNGPVNMELTQFSVKLQPLLCTLFHKFHRFYTDNASNETDSQ